jgi:hypothetical protein
VVEKKGVTQRDNEVDESTANWIVNMVTNRYITINHKNASKRIRINRGCPQGGILSPFHWNLVIDDLLNYSVKDIPLSQVTSKLSLTT